MYSSERYFSTHFRCLLISRFNYTKISQLVRIRSCKILALVPPSHYEIIATLMFLGTGIWPYSRIFVKKKKKRGGKSFLLVLIVHISKLWQIFGNNLMWKMSQFYFPCIDAADPKADYVFVIRSVFRNATVYDAPYLVEGFVEMGCLMNYALKAIKAMTVFWNIKWIFTTTHARTLAEHTTPMRAYFFGATNKVPFVSVFDKK